MLFLLSEVCSHGQDQFLNMFITLSPPNPGLYSSLLSNSRRPGLSPFCFNRLAGLTSTALPGSGFCIPAPVHGGPQ